MDCLHRPAALDKAGSQVVEKLGIAGPVAHAAEVAGSPHKARSEMMLPDPVDHDTRSEGISRIGYRLGKLQTAAALFKRLRRAFAQDRQKTMRNGLTEILRGATDVDALDLLLGGVFDNVRKRIRRRQSAFQNGQFGAHRIQMPLPRTLQK